MADFKIAYEITSKHEGGYANDPDDKGGETYAGITRKNFPNWKGWATVDMKTREHNERIPELDDCVKLFYLENFWNNLRQVASQVIANFTYDYSVHSSKRKAIKALQRAVSVTDDGILGKDTLSAVNAANEGQLLDKLKSARIAYFKSIVAKDPTQEKYYDGWLDRVESFTV